MPGPVIGSMKKGEIITQPSAQPDEAGAPHRAGPAGPVPRGDQHMKETHKTVGANTRKPR